MRTSRFPRFPARWACLPLLAVLLSAGGAHARTDAVDALQDGGSLDSTLPAHQAAPDTGTAVAPMGARPGRADAAAATGGASLSRAARTAVAGERAATGAMDAMPASLVVDLPLEIDRIDWTN